MLHIARRDISIPSLVDDVESSPLIQTYLHCSVEISRSPKHRLVVLFYDI